MKPAAIAKTVVSAAVLALAVSTSPFAQKAGDKAAVRQALRADGANDAPAKAASVARLRQVEGNVLVSQEAGLGSAAESARLEDRSRVITTANGRAVIVYDDGCETTVEPNQRVEVRSDRECAARVAEATFADPGGAGLVAPAGLLSTGALVAAGAGMVAGAVGLDALVVTRQTTTVSPN